MLKVCFIFVVSKARIAEGERRDEDSERGDEKRERRYRERKVRRARPGRGSSCKAQGAQAGALEGFWKIL